MYPEVTIRFRAGFQAEGVELETSNTPAVRVRPTQPLPTPAANGAVDVAALGTWLDQVLTGGGATGLAGLRKCWIRFEGEVWDPEVAAVFALPWPHLRFQGKCLLLEREIDIALTCRPSGAATREVSAFKTPGTLLILGDDDAHLVEIQRLAHTQLWRTRIATTVDTARPLLEEGGWRFIYCAGDRGEGAPNDDEPLLRLSNGVLRVADHIGGAKAPALVVFNVPGTARRGLALQRFLERADIVIGHQTHLVAANQTKWGYVLMERILVGRQHPAVAARDAARPLPGRGLAPLVWEQCASWDDGARAHYAGPQRSPSDVLGHALQLNREDQWRHVTNLRRRQSAIVLGYGSARQSVHRFFERIARDLDLGATALTVNYELHGPSVLESIARRFASAQLEAAPVVLRKTLRHRRLDVLVGCNGTLEVRGDGPTTETQGTIKALEALLASEDLAEAVSSEAPYPVRLFVMLQYAGDAPAARQAAVAALDRVAWAVAAGPSESTFEVERLPEFQLPNEAHVATFLDYIDAKPAERRLVERLRKQLEANPSYTFDQLLHDIEKELGE